MTIDPIAAARPPVYTGERPCWGHGLFGYDEARALAPYTYAFELAGGRRVLDAGCGEGFGTRVLAQVAKSVEGIDYSTRAIDYCTRTWSKPPGLTFRVVDLAKTAGGPPVYDLVTNFQVIEHIQDDVNFARTLRRWLAPAGTLVVVTPNRLTSSFSENPYHVREYTAAELEERLRGVFGSVEMHGVQGSDKVLDFDRRRRQTVARILRLDPLRLRRFLPLRLAGFAFGRLAVVVRRIVFRDQPELEFGAEDFFVNAERLDEAVDLLAVCRV